MAARDDILPSELTEDQRVVVERVTDLLIPQITTSQGVEYRERMRQPRPAQDLDGFYRLVYRAIQDKLRDDAVTEENKLVFTEEFPPLDMETETITYSLSRREPATMGGPPFEGKRHELKPFIRSIESDPNHLGFKVFTFGQQFENEVRLTCWAKTNKQVNRRVMWLEDLMREYAWFLKYNGVMECFLLRRLADDMLDLDGTGNIVHARSLIYYVRTERLTHLSEPTIRRVVVKYDTDTDVNN